MNRQRPQVRCCDEPGCTAEGQFRAPRSRARLGDSENYLWLCLDHVRAYNAAWNYYQGMSEDQIESELRRDTVWQRPTWPLGWRTALHRMRDPLDIMGGDGPEAERAARKRPLSDEEKALILFDLEPPFTLNELKRRYKVLVKLNHPDAHGGDKMAEERLKAITLAYALLKERFFSPRDA
ncbi:MAG TPA: J domain-containing protein [Aliidongia sp.]|nr:J domain-containing protein [Aliidongia sp.]